MPEAAAVSAPPARGFRVQPWMVSLAAALVYLAVVFVRSGGDPLAFVYLPAYDEAEQMVAEGYDGERVYRIALDPLGAPPQLDVAAYRMQRILLPILARLLAFGQPALIPWALVAISLAALAAGTALLSRLLAAEGASPWHALAYGLSAGVLLPVRLSLTEPLAYALALAGVWFQQRKQPWRMAAAFALAGLAKEQTLVFPAAVVLWLLVERRWGDAARLAGVVFGVFAAWQAVLYLWLGRFGVGSGAGLATGFEMIPYNGLWRILTETGSLLAFGVFAALLLPLAVLPSVWGLAESLTSLARRRWHPYVFLLLANAAVIMPIPFSTFREPLGMVRIVPGLTAAFLLYGARYRRRWMLAYGLLWLATGTLAFTTG